MKLEIKIKRWQIDDNETKSNKLERIEKGGAKRKLELLDLAS
jgi:hypothetical protein